MEQPIVSWRDVRVPLPLRFLYYAFLTNCQLADTKFKHRTTTPALNDPQVFCE